jgi:hypothetical protein
VIWFPVNPGIPIVEVGPDFPGVVVPDVPALGMSIDPGYPPDEMPTEDQILEAPYQIMRYIRVVNRTQDPVTVHLQYRTKDQDTWVWLPADPQYSDEALQFTLDPGQSLDLSDQDWQIMASRVIFWADSAKQKWEDFKDNQMWVVPEVGDDGKHRYQSDNVQTYKIEIR